MNRRISSSDSPISIVNASTVMTDEEILKITEALQIQVDRDYSKAWYCTAKLEFVPKGKVPKKGNWVLACLDDPDVSGALGYHDLTAEGLPLGKAFVKLDIDNGYLPSTTISHELLEMVEDPYIGYCYQIQTSTGRYRNYALEVCDSPEDDANAYSINNIKVSDFVFPSWFVMGDNIQSKPPYDFKKIIQEPYELLQGGYIGYQDVSKSAEWNTLTAKTKRANAIHFLDSDGKAEALQKIDPPRGSRRERRQRGPRKWLYSKSPSDIRDKAKQLLFK